MSSSILWKSRVDVSLDRCHLSAAADGWRLAGTALLMHESTPLEVRYAVITDAEWHTRSVGVHVQGPGDDLRLALAADGEGHWSASNEPVAALDGCLDVDLMFTPATNTLPIRRLRLDVGDAADIAAAYVALPDLALSRNDQRYERLADNLYRYSSGRFTAELVVDSNGLVVDYEGIWQSVG